MNKTHLIVVFGLPRSGKDTLIKYIRDSWNSCGRVNHAVPILDVSSITHVKNFLREVEARLHLEGVDRTSQGYRQTLATIKDALDKLFDYTVETAKMMLVDAHQSVVIIYQVRELNNIHKLAVMCEENKIEMTSVMVIRAETKEDAKEVAASPEKYPASAWEYADFVVRNDYDLATLMQWAEFVVERVEQTFAVP